MICLNSMSVLTVPEKSLKELIHETYREHGYFATAIFLIITGALSMITVGYFIKARIDAKRS